MTTTTRLEGLDDLAGRLVVAEASVLARGGRYEEARSTLSSVPESPEALDLLARMSAQQGRFGEAEGFWRRAGRLVGDDGTFDRPLARARRDQALPRSSRSLALGLRFMVLCVLMAGLFLAGKATARDDTEGRFQALRTAVLSNLKDQRDAQRVTDSQLIEQLRQVQSTADDRRQTSVLDPIAAKVRGVGGLEVSRVADRLLVRFAQPVFTEGVVLSPMGETSLRELATAIEGDGPRLFAVVTGHTDGTRLPGIPGLTDNTGLGLARGRAGAERLRSYGFPADSLALGVSTGPPFPDNDPETRRRNRTLTLELLDRASNG